MNAEQAYIEGFIKRSSEYGFSYNEAVALLKQAAPGLVNGGTMKVAPQHINELGAALATKAPTGAPIGPTWSGGIETMPPAARKALRLPTVNSGTSAATAQPQSSNAMTPAQIAASQNDLGRFTR